MAADHIETFTFKAEINQLLGLIMNTTDYIDREIFLRELISNSSDALDIVKFESLTDKSTDEELDILYIRLVPDQHEKTISIIDNGVGMSRVDLVNLGTIARSGMKDFVDALQAGDDVTKELSAGFYSSFFVAKKVTVTSKNDYDDQYLWESEAAKGSFTLTSDVDGEQLGRGTKVTLSLTHDQWEYLDKSKIKYLVKKHSDFITYPIYLWTKKTVEEQINADADDDPEHEDEDEGWDVSPFCNICEKKFANDGKMREHQSKIHRTADVFCVVQAPSCGRRFFNRAEMVRHCHRRHPRHPNVR